jgi:hypothetical protein
VIVVSVVVAAVNVVVATVSVPAVVVIVVVVTGNIGVPIDRSVKPLPVSAPLLTPVISEGHLAITAL